MQPRGHRPAHIPDTADVANPQIPCYSTVAISHPVISTALAVRSDEIEQRL